MIIEKLSGIPLISLIRETDPDVGELYLVGGAIRDIALETVPSEFDFVARHPAGSAKRIARVLGSRAIKLGRGKAVIYRVPLSDGGLDFSKLDEPSIEKDLHRRDFTVNSMAVSIGGMSLSDPLHGLSDLNSGVLRASSGSSFRDDPLRVVKAYRMRATFPDLVWDAATRVSCRENACRLPKVPAERIQIELIKTAAARSSSLAFSEMAEDGVLFKLFPELEKIKGLEHSTPHRTDVLSHTLEMLRLLDEGLSAKSDPLFTGLTARELVRLKLSVLFHDAGKAGCLTREGNRIRFLGHEKISAEIARGSMLCLRFSNAAAHDVSSLCLLHMRPLLLHGEGTPSSSALRRLIRDAGENSKLLLILSLLDFSSMKRSAEELEDYRSFCGRFLETVENEGREIISPPKLIDGMRALSILRLDKPGPALGKALLALSDAQTDGNVVSTEDAVRFLEDYRERHSES